MVWIEIVKGDIGGTMVDGFTPDERYLKGVALKVVKSGMLTRMEKLNLRNLIQYGHPGKMSENSLFNLFDKLKFYITTRQLGSIKKNAIPYWASCLEHINKLKSLSFFFTSGENMRSLESRVGRYLRGKEKHKALTVLIREYNNNRHRTPRKHYFQNVLIYERRSNFYSEEGRGYCETWTDLLNFEVKRKESYVEFEAFRDIWEKILDHQIDRYLELSR